MTAGWAGGRESAPWGSVRMAGDSAILLEFGESTDPVVNGRVQRAYKTLAELSLDGVRGLVPAFASLLVEYDPLAVKTEVLVGLICGMDFDEASDDAGRVWDIPVRYGGDYGPDLDDVASRLDRTPEAVVNLHQSQPYRIYCLGFAPGFPLAGILPPELRLPRRSTPRTAVYAGAVAIAGAQTGIYPAKTPGGWHLIGQTPMPLFDWRASPPCRYAPGDFLRFRAVSIEEHEHLLEERLQGRLGLQEILP